MSILVMAQVWKHSPEVGTGLLVELALADFANDEGYCWPSVPTIAEKSRCSIEWVRQVMRRLRAAGRLETVSLSKGGRGQTNLYKLHPSGLNPQLNRGLAGTLTPNWDTETPNSVGITPNPALPDPSLRSINKESSLSKAAKKERSKIEDVDDNWVSEQIAIFPNIDVFGEVEQWRDWIAATGRIYKDWQAGCRYWLRRSNGQQSGRTQGVRANPNNGGFESSGIRTSGFHDGTGFVLDP